MVDAVAKAAGVSAAIARRALMLSGDLTRTAELALTAGEEGLREVGFELFRPILPMLASTAESVADAVASFERASVEWKLDGIRIQIHRRDEEVRIYTRNLNEITDALPGIVDAVRRLPVSRRCSTARRCGWATTARPRSRTPSRRSTASAPPEGIATFLFDVLHVDGEDLLDTPLEERAARLEAIAPQLKVPSVITSDPDDGAARPRRVAARRARGRRRQGRRVALRGGPSRQGLAQGQAGPDLRPRRARRRVGPRPPAGLALEPPPRRPRPGHRRLRDGRQVLQGTDGRAARVADEGAARARDRPAGDRGARAPGARRRDRARRRPVLDPLPGRRRAALRARQALPPGQERRGSRHDRRPARAPPVRR